MSYNDRGASARQKRSPRIVSMRPRSLLLVLIMAENGHDLRRMALSQQPYVTTHRAHSLDVGLAFTLTFFTFEKRHNSCL